MTAVNIKPDVAEVKAMRERDSIGLQQAARILMKRNALKAIADAEDLPTLKAVLVEVVKEFI